MKTSYKLTAAALLASALLAGCGGDVGGGGGSGAGASIANSTSALFAYVNGLITSNTDETSEPVDINDLTLAVDDTAEPTPII